MSPTPHGRGCGRLESVPVLAQHARHVLVPPIGAVMIMDQLFFGNAGRIDDAEPFHGKAFAAWALGSIAAVIVHVWVPEYGEALIGLAISGATYALLGRGRTQRAALNQSIWACTVADAAVLRWSATQGKRPSSQIAEGTVEKVRFRLCRSLQEFEKAGDILRYLFNARAKAVSLVARSTLITAHCSWTIGWAPRCIQRVRTRLGVLDHRTVDGTQTVAADLTHAAGVAIALEAVRETTQIFFCAAPGPDLDLSAETNRNANPSPWRKRVPPSSRRAGTDMVPNIDPEFTPPTGHPILEILRFPQGAPPWCRSKTATVTSRFGKPADEYTSLTCHACALGSNAPKYENGLNGKFLMGSSTLR
jgi:hypothetical protein